MKEYMEKHLNSLHIVNNKQFCSPKAYCHYNKTTKLSVQAFSERIQIAYTRKGSSSIITKDYEVFEI